MRKIVTPATEVINGKALGLRKIVALVANNDAQFNLTGPGIRSGGRVLARCAEDGAELELETEDYERLAAAFEKPQVVNRDGTLRDGFIVTPGVLLAPFSEAIRAAKES
jgi:hypothetical protein